MAKISKTLGMNSDEIMEELRSNLVFCSSLGSGELFHSNILGMLLLQGESEDKSLSEFSTFLANTLFYEKKDKRKKYRIISVFREYRKFDLFITVLEDSVYKMLNENRAGKVLLEHLRIAVEPLSLRNIDDDNYKRMPKNEKGKALHLLKDSCKFIVIENKFKSLPKENQLNEYHDKVREGLNYIVGAGKNNNVKIDDGNTTFYLLAPRCSLQSFGMSSMPWNPLGYEDIVTEIDFFVNQKLSSTSKKSFTWQYIQKYSRFVRILMSLCSHKIQEPIENKNVVFPDESFAQKLDSIRIRDFYEKLWFSLMACRMCKNVPCRKDVRVEVESGYGREAGLMGYKCFMLDGSDIAYGIQIQNRQFRFYVEPSPKKNCTWAHFDSEKFQDILNQVKYDTLCNLKFTGIDEDCSVQ